MVVKLFGEVENKNVPVPEFPEHPFQEEHLRVSQSEPFTVHSLHCSIGP